MPDSEPAAARLQVILDVTYRLNGGSIAYLREYLEKGVTRFIQDGGRTGHTPAETVSYEVTVRDGVSHWDEDADYPVDDWKYEVGNDDTRLGYHPWVLHQREIEKES